MVEEVQWFSQVDGDGSHLQLLTCVCCDVPDKDNQLVDGGASLNVSELGMICLVKNAFHNSLPIILSSILHWIGVSTKGLRSSKE